MYIDRPELARTVDLDQGDILENILVPEPPVGKNLGMLRHNNAANKKCLDWPAQAANLKNPGSELRAFSALTRCSAIVLSNSCDNYQGGFPLLFAPIRTFAFDARSSTDADKWMKIRQAATGSATAKSFYLPGSAKFKMDRCEAILPEMFRLTHGFLERCLREAGTRRVCGLTSEAQRHLQWAISLLFGRDPRDDDAWPSSDDFRLKLAWIDAQLGRAGLTEAEKVELEAERVRTLGKVAGEAAAPDAPAAAEPTSKVDGL